MGDGFYCFKPNQPGIVFLTVHDRGDTIYDKIFFFECMYGIYHETAIHRSKIETKRKERI